MPPPLEKVTHQHIDSGLVCDLLEATEAPLGFLLEKERPGPQLWGGRGWCEVEEASRGPGCGTGNLSK